MGNQWGTKSHWQSNMALANGEMFDCQWLFVPHWFPIGFGCVQLFTILLKAPSRPTEEETQHAGLPIPHHDPWQHNGTLSSRA
jgi:hypothetical protein